MTLLPLSSPFVTIRHSSLARSFTSFILCPSFILYCKTTAYYYFYSTLSAMILNTPDFVTIANRSPRKLAQISPSIDAEWRMVVGKMLYTLFPTLYPPSEACNFYYKFSFIFHNTIYPPWVVCIMYFIDGWSMRFKLRSHIMIVGRKWPTTTIVLKFTT